MKHPNREEWAPYLFGEAKPDARQRLTHHLQECADCRQEINIWQRSLRRLDAWEVPDPPLPRRHLVPSLRWAAAAAIILAFGFGIGRLSSGAVNAQKLRASIEPQIRQQLLAEFDKKRAQDNQALYAALDKLYVSLKRDVDTVAVYTDAGLRQAQQQLVELADYAQPAEPPNPAPKQN